METREDPPDDLEAVRNVVEVLKPFAEKDRDRILRWSQEKLRSDSPGTMDDFMRQEWSRHYDMLHWRIIGFLSAAMGALLVYSFAEPSSRIPSEARVPVFLRWWIDVWPQMGGIALTVVVVYFAASFRRFRLTLHRGIVNDELRGFLLNSGYTGLPHQWLVFVGAYAIIVALFTYSIAAYTSPGFVFLPGGIAICILAVLWTKAKPERTRTLDVPPNKALHPAAADSIINGRG